MTSSIADLYAVCWGVAKLSNKIADRWYPAWPQSMMDNHTLSVSDEIYYPRGATIFASVCAVVFSIIGVTGNYEALKSDHVTFT